MTHTYSIADKLLKNRVSYYFSGTILQSSLALKNIDVVVPPPYLT